MFFNQGNQQTGYGNQQNAPLQLDTRTFIQGLPRSNTVVPNIHVSPDMDPYVPAMAGYCRAALQFNAEKNAARALLYNIMSQNNFSNGEFANFVFGACQYAEAMALTEQAAAQQFDMAMEQAASDMASMMAVIVAEQSREIHHLLSQEFWGGSNEWKAKYQAVTNLIAQLERSRQNQNANVQFGGGQQMNTSRYGGGNVAFRQMGGGQPQNTSAFPAGGMRGGAYGMGSSTYTSGRSNASIPQHFTNTNDAMVRRASGLGPRNQQTQNEVPTDTFKSGRHNVEEFGDNTETNTGFFRRSNTSVTEQPTHVTQPSQPQQREEVKPVEITHEINDGLVSLTGDPDRPYDHLLSNGRYEMVPAHLSSWTVDRDEDNPYPPLFDPTKQILFHSLDRQTGKVTEVLKETIPAMDYLKHELQNSQRTTKIDHSKGRIVPSWESVETMKKVPLVDDQAVEIEGTGDDIDPATDPMVLPDILVAHNLRQAEIIFESCMVERNIDHAADIPTEYYFDQVSPLYTKIAGQSELVMELRKCQNLLEIKNEMIEGSDRFDLSLWYDLNHRFTAAINEALKVNLQLKDLYIDSFVDDYAELVDVLYNQWGDRMVRVLNQNEKGIIRGVCNILGEDATNEYISHLAIYENVDYAEYKSKIVTLKEGCSVTNVPWDLADFSTSISDSAAMVKSSTTPELYKAVKGIFDRTMGLTNRITHHYILTRDRQVVEVYRGWMAADCYLIRKVSL